MELLVLIPLVGFILFWQRRQSSTLSTAALHVTATLILLLYIGGLSGWLPAARIVLLGLGTALLVNELLRHPGQHLRSLLSVPLLTLLGASILFFLAHGSSEFRYYDEFSHWGINLKETLSGGGFWGADTNSKHPRLPPGPTLWQYFFIFSEIPREGAAYFAQFLLLVLPLLVLFESMHWKRPGWIAGVVVLLLFGFGNFGHGIASLYADHVLAAWLAGLFLNFMAEPRDRRAPSLVLYVLPLSALALFKNAGLFFALAVPVMLLLLLWLRLRDTSTRAHKRLAPTLLLVLIAWISGPLITTSAWSHNRDALGTTHGILSAPGLVGILTGKVTLQDPQRAQTVNAMFSDVFFHQQLSKNNISDKLNEFSYNAMPLFQDRFRLTTASFLILYLAWSGFLIWRIAPASLRLDWAVGLAAMLGIALAYITLLYLTYLFHLNGLVSYIRYVHSVILALLLAGMAPLLPVFAPPSGSPGESGAVPGRPLAAIIFTFALLALLVVEKPHIQSLLRPVASPLTAFRSDIRPVTDRVRTAVGDRRLWLYLPDPNPHNLTSRILLYELAPTPTTVNRDFAFFDQSRDAILEAWSGYDFVWVPLDSPELDEKLRSIAGPDLGERLYRSTAEGDAVHIEPAVTRASE